MREDNTQKKILERIRKEKIGAWAYELFGQFPQSQVYLVGGAIRDLILEKSRELDYDFVVANVPPNELEKFLKARGEVNLVGKKFGVFKFKSFALNEVVDIALPRTEHPLLPSGKKRDFKIFSNHNLPIGKDLSRRDFTMNALALSLRENKLLDPFSGLADIKKKVVRAVGDPEERFKEDCSRILRALRFACQLDFRIEKQTFESLRSLSGNLKKLPEEILAAEILKSFASHPLKAFDLYEKSGVLDALIPEVIAMKGRRQSRKMHREGDVFAHTRLALKRLKSSTFKRYFPQGWDSATVMATLFHDIGKPETRKAEGDEVTFYQHEKVGAQIARSICERLKLSSPKKLGVNCPDLYWLIRNHSLIFHADPAEIRATTLENYFYHPRYPGQALLKLFLSDQLATLSLAGKPNITRFKRLIKRLKGLEETKEKPPGLSLRGEEIMRILKIKPGPKVGEIKRALREEQLSGKIGSRDEAVEYVKKCRGGLMRN